MKYKRMALLSLLSLMKLLSFAHHSDSSNNWNFSNAKFENKNFSTIHSGRYFSFYSSELKDCNFKFAYIEGFVTFFLANLKGYTNFSSLIMRDSGDIVFIKTKLPDLICFNSNDNIQKIDFTKADFDSTDLYLDKNGRWHYINLYRTNLSKVLIDYTHFKLCFFDDDIRSPAFTISSDTLIVKDKAYDLKSASLKSDLLSNDIFLNYIKKIFPSTSTKDTVIQVFIDYCINNKLFPKTISEDEITSIYEKVLKNFEEQGLKVSYQNLDVEYRNYKNGYFILPRIWNCYGYHKEWIFYWTFSLVLLFSIICFFFLNILNKSVTQNGIYYIENVPSNIKVDSLKTFMRRAWYSFVYTSSIFFLFKLSLENMNFKRAWIIYVIIVYSVGLLCLGYIANFVLQK